MDGSSLRLLFESCLQLATVVSKDIYSISLAASCCASRTHGTSTYCTVLWCTYSLSKNDEVLSTNVVVDDDVINTNTDVINTNADVINTNADDINTNADVINRSNTALYCVD